MNLQVLQFGFLQQKWQETDELFLIVSDTKRLDVSTVHPAKLKRVMARAKFTPSVSPETRARQLLVPPDDKVSQIVDLTYLGSVETESGGWRHFVFVSGCDFCFKERLGREFVTSTANLSLNFGPINGPIVEKIIAQQVPHMSIIAPAT